MTRTPSPRIVYAALLVLALSVTLYEELYLRRWLFQRHGVSAVIAGSLPNFLAVVIVSFGVMAIKLPITGSAIARSILAIVIGLSAYEVAQIWMPNRVFDWNDLAATLLGGIAAWIIIAITRRVLASGQI